MVKIKIKKRLERQKTIQGVLGGMSHIQDTEWLVQQLEELLKEPNRNP